MKMKVFILAFTFVGNSLFATQPAEHFLDKPWASYVNESGWKKTIAGKNVSKMLIEIKQADKFLFALKREPESPEKDRRLEMIGGKLEAGESFYAALVREAQEEELSGSLKAFIMANKNILKYRLIEPKNEEGDYTVIFRFTIEPTLLAKIQAHRERSHELYDFKVVDKNNLFPISTEQWTAKTLKIFKHLSN